MIAILDSADVSTFSSGVINYFQPINLVTGLDPGQSFIVPAAFLSENFEITYGIGKLTILPAGANTITTAVRKTSAAGELTQEVLPGKITAYPNPTMGKVKINIDGNYKTGNDLILLDLPGRIYKPKSVNKISDNSFEVDLSNLNKGVYFIKLQVNKVYKTFKILKL